MCPTYAAASHNLDFRYAWRMEWENTLHTDAAAYLAHRERSIHTRAAPALDYRPSEHLNALGIPLYDAHMYIYRVADAKLGEVARVTFHLFAPMPPINYVHQIHRYPP